MVDRLSRRWCQGFGFLNTAVAVIAVIAIANLDSAHTPADDKPPVEGQAHKQLKEIYRNDASEYSIYRDSAKKEKLELRDEPVYVWTNVLRDQFGSVVVWTWHGRPEVIASIFSQPESNQTRGFIHELHSLSVASLLAQHSGPNRWQPKTGLKRKPITDAPKPADSPRLRLVQMRDVAKEFSARSVNIQNHQTWELRLLTQPLFRYQSTDPEIVDGALFAFVTSAGTDPEVLLLLEADKTGSEPVWNYAICRFSDLNLYVSHRDQEIWRSVRSDTDTMEHDEQHLYRLIRDRIITDPVKASKP